MRRLAMATVVALFQAFCIVASAADEGPAVIMSEQDDVVGSAIADADSLHHPLAGLAGAPPLLQRARAILIMSSPLKGKFALSQGGTGVLLTRDGDNVWSYPAFYAIDSGSVPEYVSMLVLIIISDKALQAVMRDEFKIGGDADITVAALGDAHGSATGQGDPDIYAFIQAQASGVFGGIDPRGGRIRPLPTYNEAYYGPGTRLADILSRRNVSNAGAEQLRTILRQISRSP